MLTLTWNGENGLGSGRQTDHGLTPFGRAAVPALEEAGILVDVSHLNDQGFRDVLELARRVLIYPAETAWEDVQAANPDLLPLWAEVPEATAAAEECITTLNLRYRISGNMVTPIPPPGGLRRDLRDKYLWLSGESERKAAIRWVYIVGAGWKQPAFLRQWKRYGYPLVPRYQADGITEQGAYLSLEIAPWEYDVLMRRTLERREREETRVRTRS